MNSVLRRWVQISPWKSQINLEHCLDGSSRPKITTLRAQKYLRKTPPPSSLEVATCLLVPAPDYVQKELSDFVVMVPNASSVVVYYERWYRTLYDYLKQIFSS